MIKMSKAIGKLPAVLLGHSDVQNDNDRSYMFQDEDHFVSRAGGHVGKSVYR